MKEFFRHTTASRFSVENPLKNGKEPPIVIDRRGNKNRLPESLNLRR